MFGLYFNRLMRLISVMFDTEDNFYDFLFVVLRSMALRKKGSVLKGKNLLPMGPNSFR